VSVPGKRTRAAGRHRVTSFRARSGAENSIAVLRLKGDLRGKRRDPLDRANAPPKVVADPA